jgi:uncharacterized protein (TIGR02284 family)
MTMTTTTDSRTIDTLNDLVEACKDGEYGFRSAAECARSASLRQLFNRRSEECREAAEELQARVVRLGGSAEEGGTIAGAAHRGWVAVKGTLAGYTDKALLEECERGEDIARESYRAALVDGGLTGELLALVARQAEGVDRNHAQIRALRDEARAASR